MESAAPLNASFEFLARAFPELCRRATREIGAVEVEPGEVDDTTGAKQQRQRRKPVRPSDSNARIRARDRKPCRLVLVIDGLDEVRWVLEREVLGWAELSFGEQRLIQWA